MFKLLKLIATLSIGAVLGFHLHGWLITTECNSAGGTMNGMICTMNGVSQ
jgi:hypothetical protein